MVEKVIDFSVKNKLVVFILVAAASIWGAWSLKQVPLDAIPDLSDTQVIIYSKWDRSPDLVEDQVTYPIVTALLGAPKVKTVRGFSDFGYSYVYVIFEDGTDIYWARSRTLEYLSGVLPGLPAGVKTELGPDATGLGWIFQYVLVDTSGKHSLADLRSYQDWTLRYHLRSVPGRGRGGAHRRLRPAVPGERRPEPAAGLRHPDRPRRGGGARRQLGDGRPPHRVRRHRVHGARARATRSRSRTSRTSSSPRRRRGRPSGSGTSGRSRSGRTFGGGSRISTARARPSPASSSCGKGRTPSR